MHKQFDQINCKHLLMMYPYQFYPFFRNPYPPNKIIKNTLLKMTNETIKANPQINFFTQISNYPFSYFLSNMSYLFDALPGGLGNRLDNYNYFTGSFRASVALAIYMGFHNIYLVGFDYTHSPARIGHWYEKGQGSTNNTKFNNFEKGFITSAREYANIITVTLDGKSENLKYITYKDLTGQDPSFRENKQLIRKIEYLEKLSELYDSFYNIY